MSSQARQKQSSSRRWLVAAFASLVLHGLVALQSRNVPHVAKTPAAAEPASLSWFELAAPPTVTTVAPTVATTPTTTTAAAENTPATTQRQAQRAIEAQVTGVERTASVAATITSASDGANVSVDDATIAAEATTATKRDASASVPTIATTSPRDLDLSALSAARSVVPLDTRSTRELQASEAQATLNHALRHATRKPHLGQRPPPELTRMADGSYQHRAPGFTATIHPDGRVTFADKPPAELHLSPTFMTFDITDAMLRAMGEELYHPEKRWFIEQTAELRAQLEADDRLRWLARARDELLTRLRRIVDATRLMPSQKRDAVYALWLDCADDEVGAGGRAVIERFVREHFPQHGQEAFTASELSRRNQRSAKQRRFDPYTDPSR